MILKVTFAKLARGLTGFVLMSNPFSDANGPGRWKERQNALVWERPAKAAVVLAVLASLGALFAWTILLVGGNDVRLSGRFWLLAALPVAWMGPAQAYSRWAMRTLWLALLLWPTLALAAWLTLRSWSAATFGPHTDALLLEMAFAFTAAVSAVGLVCLRRSSLPGGTAAPEFRDNGYKPKGAQPAVDPLLVSAQYALLFPVIPVILMGSGAAAAFTDFAGQTPADAASQAVSILLVFGGAFLAAFIGLIVLGQYQARRWPSRAPWGLLALAALIGGIAVALTVAVFVRGMSANNANLAFAAMFMGCLALGVVWAEVVAIVLLTQRMRSYR